MKSACLPASRLPIFFSNPELCSFNGQSFKACSIVNWVAHLPASSWRRAVRPSSNISRLLLKRPSLSLGANSHTLQLEVCYRSYTRSQLEVADRIVGETEKLPNLQSQTIELNPMSKIPDCSKKPRPLRGQRPFTIAS